MRISDGREGELIATGLGSCVALVMWGYRGPLRVMGMAHIVLPAARRPVAEDARYAETAVAALAAALARHGCDVHGLEAVIAGGASMFGDLEMPGDVGAANVRRVREELARAGVALRAADVGGQRARTVAARPCDGRVTVSVPGAEATVLWCCGNPVRA